MSMTLPARLDRIAWLRRQIEAKHKQHRSAEHYEQELIGLMRLQLNYENRQDRKAKVAA